MMTPRRRLTLAALLLGAAIALFAPPAAAQEATISALNEAIGNWQLPEAKNILDTLESGGEPSAELMFQHARYDYFSGSYATALDRIDQAVALSGGDNARYAALRATVAATAEVVKDYKEFKSPNGYFVVRVEPGKDELLVPYAFETLEAAYERLGDTFGHRPPPPVVVEIYPKAATLAKVSGLTEDEIKTSGTIALCNNNRLMFTSPKALVKGYTWRDTLSHEFAHLVITQKSNNTVPIWMHEGLAKYNERVWRGVGNHLMSPSSENLLAKAVTSDELITFEQMHPSMAKLPSQEATALAFAEVYTVMEFVHRKQGDAAFSRLLELMREKEDAKAAITELLKVPSFERFQKDWMAYLRSRPSKTFDEEAVFIEKLEFAGDKQESELLEIGKKEARDYIRLGEMLQVRERYAAAVVEYQKARELIGDHNPILQTRLGRSLITIGRHEEAAEALAGSLAYYPNYHTTHLLLGEALLKAGELERAETHLMEALGINPFDPAVHENLAALYTRQDRAEDASRARENLRLASQ